MSNARDFVMESNRIEGIIRPPTAAELDEFNRFMALPAVTIPELESFVRVYQPNALLRDRPGLNVRVGRHVPISGGPEVKSQLESLLGEINAGRLTPFEAHIRYETLHPFTDGNGRSGRMIWAWQVRELQLGFLHRFYYQTLASTNRS